MHDISIRGTKISVFWIIVGFLGERYKNKIRIRVFDGGKMKLEICANEMCEIMSEFIFKLYALLNVLF